MRLTDKTKKLLLILPLITFLLIIFLPAITQAGVLNEALTSVGQTNQEAKLADADNPAFLVGSIIRYTLGILGIIFVILIIYGGFLWMMAGGNEESVGKAKKFITNATIGLIIVILSYAISLFIINVILKASTTLPL